MLTAAVAWQYPQTADECANLVALVAHVRAHLPPGRLVTAALPADMPLLKQVDVYQLAPHIDYMNLTAYGFRDGRHHAQLYAMSRDEPSGAAAVVHLLARGFPAKKILLGIPTHAQGTGNVGLVGGPDPALEYQHLPRRGCVEVVDRRHVAAQFVGGEAGDGSVSYDNVETVTAKAGFCKSKGLAVGTNCQMVDGMSS